MPEQQRDEVTLTIGGEEFRGWDELELRHGLDSHSSAGFRAPFDPTNRAFRQLFRPFSYARTEIKIGGKLAFTGVLVEVAPDLTPGKSEVVVSCFSLPAQLEHTEVPSSLIPSEAAGQTLSQIAKRLCDPFGIEVEMAGPEGSPFRRVKTKQKKVDGKIEATQKIADFLGELARQRALVMNSTAEGKLRFWQSAAPGRPVLSLVQGEQPLLAASVSFNPWDYYSEITGFTTTKHGKVGTKFTERNTRLSGGVLRCLNFKMDDIEKGDGPGAVKAKMARMFANCVAYTAHVPTWRDPKGELFASNTTATLRAPGLMVYRESELLIREVYLKYSSAEGRTASLGLVLPGAFSGQAPARMPWEE